ncbi:hypothetical protein ACI8AD_19560 [Geodermatophilus sp. SYSU D00766]
MTDRRSRPGSVTDNTVLATFQAEVARLVSLPPRTFAELDPGALPPLLATIRTTAKEMSRS